MVSDFTLTFRWAALPGYWGLMASAAEHAHCNTTVETALILHEGKAVMSHVKIVDLWGAGKSTLIPPGVKVTALQNGGPNETFFASVYADDITIPMVQVDSFDQTAL